MDIFKFYGINKSEYNLAPYIVIPDLFQKEIIFKDEVNINNIDGDGNCFFRNLSLFFTNDENYHHFFREILFIYMDKNNIIYENPYILFRDKLIKIIE